MITRRTFLKGAAAVALLPSLATARARYVPPAPKGEGGYIVTEAMDRHISQEIVGINSFTERNILDVCSSLGVRNVRISTSATRMGWVHIEVDKKHQLVREALDTLKPAWVVLEVNLL